MFVNDIREKIDISIVIVNYNTWDLLLNCISSIYEKTFGVSFEIIVVDNNSLDGIPICALEKYPDVKYLYLDQNKGFGKANNEALKYTNGEYVCFLNPDTVLINNALLILFCYLQQNKNVGICGANLYTEQLNPNMSYANFPSLCKELLSVFGVIRQKVEMSSVFNFGSSKVIDGYISGADIFIRRNLLSNFAFDPDFFMYYEDVELSYRIKKKGFEIHSVSDAKIIHLQGMSLEKLNDGKMSTILFLIKSKLLYFKKVSKYSCLIYMAYYVKSIFAIIYFSMIGNEKRVKFWTSFYKSVF